MTQPSVKKGEQERNASSGSIKMDLMIGAIAITQRAHNIRNENTTNFINCHSLQLHHIIYCQSTRCISSQDECAFFFLLFHCLFEHKNVFMAVVVQFFIRLLFVFLEMSRAGV